MKLRAVTIIILMATIAQGHFLTLLPESDVVTKKQPIEIEVSFLHPFEQTAMTMHKAKSITVYNTSTESLNFKETKKFSKKAWRGEYRFKRPGDYIFVVEPKEYFEPAEEKFIRHITKTVVNAYGLESGWERKIGLDVEIVPLIKPYGLYKGNTFSGQVFHHGKPAKNIEVEVELYNDKNLKAPTDAHITQVVKTDINGVFHYTMPFSGWWGFAALTEEGEMKHSTGKSYPIEVGGLIWVKAY